MSKAFTRESDELPESPLIKVASTLPFGLKNYFTPQGVAKLRQEMEQLNSQSASPASRQRIFEIQQSLQTAVVVEPPPKPWRQVSFGATVTVRDPENVQHTYHDALEKLIEKKVKNGGEKLPVPKKAKQPTNVIDLVSVLQQSIKETQAKSKSAARSKAA
ncbi:MAG TPA: hypothetical protein VHY30_00455 [Verrucomicrobiae bacterium]|nr:hypothetical protein [Verrucomicrobiae bacterium]